MNEHKNVSHNTLADNEYVKELFAIMQKNGKDTAGLATLLNHVSEIENFMIRAEDKITDMKLQLAEIKEIQNRPIKATLQNTIKTLEVKVAEGRERLAELKANIIEGCKNAVAAFKEKGAAVLNNLAAFFDIKNHLQDWKKNIDVAIKADDKAIAKIKAFSIEYHSAGRAIKNMARVAIGKEPLDIKKESGKLAKALAAPYKAHKSALISLGKSMNKAIAKLEQLESMTAVKQSERTIDKKPSLLGRLEAGKERVKQIKREALMPERVKVKGAEI